MKKIFCSLSVICIVVTACSKSNDTTQSGNNNGNTGNCDTVNMKYSVNVKPILEANCYSCHGNGLSQNGVSLDTYSKVKQQADNSNLLGVINHANGYPPMPQGKPKLSACDINKIKSWIDRGALDN